MAVPVVEVPEHITLASHREMRVDNIRIFEFAFGWDYFRFAIGCYWFYLALGWMVPQHDFSTYSMALGLDAGFCFNHRRRKLQWGSHIWEHASYWRKVQAYHPFRMPY